MTKRQKLTLRVVAVGVVVVCLAAASRRFGGDSEATATPDASPNLLRVSVKRIEAVDHITRTREFTGEVKAARESQLSFERPGRILAISVDEGDSVATGQVLATVDVEHVAIRLESVNAQLEQASALLAELEAGPRKETIASSRANVSSLASEVKRLQLDFDRAQQLYQSNSVSKERFDQTKYQLEFAVAQRDSTQKQLDELLAGTRVEKLDAQRAVLKQLHAEIQSLQLDLKDGQLKAPYCGRIAERHLDEGTVVAASVPVFRLVEQGKLQAWVGIPPPIAKLLRLGETYGAEVDGDRLNANLISLRPRLDPVTRTQNAVFNLAPNDSARLVPGQIIRLRLEETIDAAGYVLPTSALVPGPRGLWNVFVVVKDGGKSRVELRNAELLYALGESSLVQGTLQEGDAVISEGVHRVVAGQVVEPAEVDNEVLR